jgi:hypothetical protein
LRFEPDRLAADLEHVRPEDWIEHDLSDISYVEGTYRVAPLVSVHGASDEITTYFSEHFSSTPILERCPYLQYVIAQFRSPLSRVRLMALDADSALREHVDLLDLDPNFPLARFHVPLVTNPGAYLMLDGQRVAMEPGECWYAEASLPHGAFNEGDAPRVHLLLDCKADEHANELVGYDICAYRARHAEEFEHHRQSFLREFARATRRGE